MNAAKAQKLMRCHRGDAPNLDDSRVQKAVRLAETKEDLAAELRQQKALDEQLRAIVQAIPLPGDLAARIRSQPQASGQALQWRSALKQPAVLAAVIGLLVMLGFGVYYWMGYLESFPGKEAVVRMILTTDEMSGLELEQLPAATQAGELGDWFFLHYGLERYDVPQEFANLHALGSRVFKQDGLPIAQIAIETNNMLFFIFRASDFGVKLTPPERWRIFEQEEWVVALRGEEENCFMIAFKGKKADMNALLNPNH